ncbi:MAG: YicC family protein, partial [Verrucomicrobia bacterium]|nr:YicC family protein [Verrucomicrobiota bacterium]
MTGYGGAYVSKAGIKVTVDVSSLNRKQGEVFISLPRDFDSLEPLIREDCNSCISRGRLTVRVGIQVEE